MTKRDYEFLAEFLRETRPDEETPYALLKWRSMAAELTLKLMDENERFNPAQFRAAYNA